MAALQVFATEPRAGAVGSSAGVCRSIMAGGEVGAGDDECINATNCSGRQYSHDFDTSYGGEEDLDARQRKIEVRERELSAMRSAHELP